MATDWTLVRRIIHDTNENIVLYGPPSVGKSYAFLHHNGKPVTVQCHEGMLAVELFVGRMPRDGSMVNVPGPLAIAARDNREILFQELDRFNEECLSVAGMAADDPETRVISWAGDDDTMHEYTPEPPFRAVATMNKGPESVTEALASRFIWLYVDEPAPEALATLPASLREAARVLAGHPDPLTRVSFRAFKRYTRMLSVGFSNEEAAQANFGKRWDSFLDAESLAGLVDRAEANRD